jgi:hypothetical protein
MARGEHCLNCVSKASLPAMGERMTQESTTKALWKAVRLIK